MLDEGDLVMVDFEPLRGSEQGGARPAIVLTDRAFHETRSTAIVCPITNNLSPWPTKVLLPEDLPVRGAILCEQVRAVSRAGRGFRPLGQVPVTVLEQVRRVIGDVLHILD